ncbi:MAG: hypothetical protein IT328_04575 [Caldilineaceae bacterium]|nr:hypothetical protein [Caldilineaceae bacterium]
MSSVRAAFEKQFPPIRKANGLIEDRFWVRDIFEEAVIVHDETERQLYRVAMTRGSDGITFEPRNKWAKVKLTYATEMVTDSVITEFKGKPPEVPVRAGIDLAELTKGDDDPFFLTLEISTEGRVSKNGLVHDAALGTTLLNHINGQAAEGIMGHIKEADRSSAFPVSDVHWLGAARQGGSTWAKGYIPKTAVAQREHFRILLATNGKAATSITGPAVREFVDKKKGTWKAKNFQLEQLDLAPYTRAALPPESDFVITREMSYEREEQTEMTKEELIAELTAGDIPQALRESIIAEHTRAAGQQNHVTELETNLKQSLEMVAELTAQVEAYAVKEFEAAVDAKVAELSDWQVTEEDDKKVLASFRKNLRARIISEMGDDRALDRIQEIAQSVWADFEVLAETVRDRLAGPAAVVAGRGAGGAGSTRTEAYKDDLVKRAKELRAQHGI